MATFRRGCGGAGSTALRPHCFAFLPADAALRLVVALGLVTLAYVTSFYRGLYDPRQDGAPLQSLGSSVVKNATTDSSAKPLPKSHYMRLHSTLSEPLPQQSLKFLDVPTAEDFDRDETSWYSSKLCRRDQIIEGRWVPEHMNEPPYRPTVVHLRCYPREAYYSPDGWDTHAWLPNAAASGECDLGKWRKETYCAVAKHATVMIAGDSLSWEHYASLVQLLGTPTHQGYQHMSREFGRNVGQAVCGGKSRVVYRRDDRLTQLRHALLEDTGSNHIPHVLVLNRGAHYANDTDFMDNLRFNLDVVEEWQTRCDELRIKCHFFWRTTVPGHPNCWNDTSPVHDKAAIEARIANLTLYDDAKIHYHWYDFQHQNVLAEAELKQRGMRHRILDAYHLNVLRPDEHRAHQNDCLHSCYPGKMDVYSRLLLHYLRIDRTAADVAILKSVAKEQGWNTNVTTVYDKNATLAATAQRVAAGGRLPDRLPTLPSRSEEPGA
jgi:GDSL/SGNH-like Acyl-Esterase family found in Pmr5 and Cas1p